MKLGVIWLTIVTLLFSGVPARADTAPPLHDAAGLHVVALRRIDDRLLQVTLRTPALRTDTRVRILPGKGCPCPVLYLLHGGYDSYSSWTDKGSAEALTAGLRLTVVMPDGGPGGWYSNWYNSGAGGPPEWERYHIGELLPWVDANLSVTGRQAIAGLSMGGFGALSYAARHPGLFAAAFSFSGAVDTRGSAVRAVVGSSPLATLSVPGAIWGPPGSDLWGAHDPWALADLLTGLVVGIYTGDGAAGPLDTSPGSSPVEAAVQSMSASLDARLTVLGIPHTYVDYGPGTHSWPYWSRDLRWALPAIMGALAHSGPAHSGR